MSSSFRVIVAATDFSETAAAAWRTACALALVAGSRLHLVHVLPDPLQQTWTADGISVDLVGHAAECRREAEARLALVLPTSALANDRITRTVITGTAHQALAQYAAEQQAGLIVMGTHGYGPVKHLLLGSVADRVLRQAVCPVLMVPSASLRQPHRQPTQLATAD